MSVLPRRAIVITTIQRNSPETVSLDANMEDIYGDAGGPRKRRRLTHLSTDEKLLRRKLKNRVAAQTARDRKRVLMDDLELKVAELEAENQKLAQENSTLKVQSGRLTKQNSELKDRLSAVGRAPVKTELESGSAVSTDPLPQGQTPVPSCWASRYAASMLTVVSLTLLSAYCKQRASLPELTQSSKTAFPAIEVPITQNPREIWWGPQQRSWTPSMN